MKRALYVGAGAPWTGGAGFLVRQNTTLRALARCAKLHLALFDLPPDAPPPPFPCDITPLTLHHRPGMHGDGGDVRIRAAFADLFNPLPRLVRNIDLPATRRPLAAIDPAALDAVVAYRIDFAHYAGVLRGPRLLLDVDDPEHLRWQRRIDAAGIRPDWRTRRDLHKLRRFEQHAVAHAAHAWVCQKDEARAFPHDHVLVVPNGVLIPPLPDPRPPTPPVLLFLGNFAAGPGSPNTDALHWFASALWPLIRAQVPDARAKIAGAVPDDLRAELLHVPGLHLAGFVPSLDVAFADARLSVAPLRFGTGTRIKILDAWAHACPVVATSAGADGLPAVSGQNALLADAPAAFAEHCVALLRDPALADRLGREGCRTVAAHFNAEAIEDRLAGLFEQFLADGSVPRTSL